LLHDSLLADVGILFVDALREASKWRTEKAFLKAGEPLARLSHSGRPRQGAA
jgi:hypothetical protein